MEEAKRIFILRGGDSTMRAFARVKELKRQTTGERETLGRERQGRW